VEANCQCGRGVEWFGSFKVRVMFLSPLSIAYFLLVGKFHLTDRAHSTAILAASSIKYNAAALQLS
jgi:hypothetical protein